ncbi:nuclease-related domain-containing protein [uncultured Hyphomicrobium sp.]|jgi:hypothetical protein|uniref:nuclease-related domain-containing protein n=1 Tax=uncultured Hyphomicrobium sp. TaxID=194373 RepID=UPI0025D785F0|nr:nuclease-related domain-containing protein [uncultured Hyphomicrobium sp.]
MNADDSIKATGPKAAPRQADEIFGDLRALCHSPGALHAVSSIVYRDFFLTVSMREGRVLDGPERRWSTSKLNNNELMLLVGLIVQSTVPHTYSTLLDDESLEEQADRLLQEFHERLLADAAPIYDSETGTVNWPDDALTLMGREAIYYGADSLYLHQFKSLSRHRYREDSTWLLQNAGLSVGSMIDIASFISNRINAGMTRLGQMRRHGAAVGKGDLTNSLLISKSDLYRKFKSRADAYLKRFATPATCANVEFTSPFSVNAAAIAPIVDIGNYIFVPNQYRLFESIYESPFYWMMADKCYAHTHAKHRGAFLERSTAHILRRVFGDDCVFENVQLFTGSSTVVGEIDVLVVYGEFAIVVQAKSKRMTIKARSGDQDAMKADFQDAIQTPYQQALDCIKHLKSDVRCIDKCGREPSLHSLPQFFPLVVLSDPFPAITYLSRAMLKTADGLAPAVWDLGVLDCVTRILPTPIEMMFYLKCRSDTFEQVISDSEYNMLGYHLKAKLALAPDVDGLYLDRGFATSVDDYMISRDVGLDVPRPEGVLERANFPVVTDLLALLKNSDPRLSSIAVELYDFSGSALAELSKNIVAMRSEVVATGKAIKALSVVTASGGLTYAVARDRDEKAMRAAEAIAAKHKYDRKQDRWYVVLDSVETGDCIDAMLPLVWAWEPDQAEAANSVAVAKMFKGTYQPFKRVSGDEPVK